METVEKETESTNYLVVGPPSVGKRGYVSDQLRDSSTPVVVITTRGVDAVLESYGDVDGVVNCSAGQEGAIEKSPDDLVVVEVGSPGDLTGIGISVSDVLDGVTEGDEKGPVYVVLDSVSTLLMYSDSDRVYRFIDNFIGGIRNIDGVSFTVSDSPLDGEAAALKNLFDERVEFRETDGGFEYRVSSEGDGWKEFEGRAPERGSRGSRGREAPGSGEYDVDSLSEVVDEMLSHPLKLTVYNYEGDSERIREFFDGFGVDVEVAEASGPKEFVVLHQEGEYVASDSVNLVLANIRGEEDNVDVSESEVVESVKRSFFETRGSDKRTLIRVSREIEARAWSDGAGELHAGFQTIERFRDNMERDVYTSLAESDLDVHIYGVGEAPSDGEFTYHTEDTEEIRDTWFVVHTGISPAALVAEERESGVYYGFWTYSSDFVEEIARYLRSEYPS